MNLPNKLTCGRLLLTVVFVAVMSLPAFPNQVTLGLILFLIASLTDFLDGYLARKLGLVTDFGKLMDPLADKILTGAVFIILTAQGVVPAWATILIITREFLVTGLRLVAAAKGAVMAADNLGKWKTTAQIVAAVFFMMEVGNQRGNEAVLKPFAGLTNSEWLGHILLGAALLLTAVSGFSYLAKNRDLVSEC